MNIPENELGLTTTEELINWTASYLHFKQALEVLELTPEITQHYLKHFVEYRERLAKDLIKQGFLEARLPKENNQYNNHSYIVGIKISRAWDVVILTSCETSRIIMLDARSQLSFVIY